MDRSREVRGTNVTGVELLHSTGRPDRKKKRTILYTSAGMKRGVCFSAPLPDLFYPNLGGFRTHLDHEAYIFSTINTIQLDNLVTQDALDRLDVDCAVDVRHPA